MVYIISEAHLQFLKFQVPKCAYLQLGSEILGGQDYLESGDFMSPKNYLSQSEITGSQNYIADDLGQLKV